MHNLERLGAAAIACPAAVFPALWGANKKTLKALGGRKDCKAISPKMPG